MAPLPDAPGEAALAFARAAWPEGEPGGIAWEPVPADGSPRRFYRLAAGGHRLVLLANPGGDAENRAWLGLAAHLAGHGLPVPRVVAADPARGLFLMEDLGRESLQDRALGLRGDHAALIALYRPVLALLARLQARGGEGLDRSLCFDGEELTPEFLLQREAGYFLEQLVRGALRRREADLPPGLTAELAELCRRAGEAGPRGLVHRDFQSRNLVWNQGRLGLVDFQGARLGPAQYDLASLLNDPYVDLAWPLRERLLAEYLEIRAGLGVFDRVRFLAGWPHVALSRIMQALGAYAFLTRVRGRRRFAAYFAPALATLKTLAAGPIAEDMPAFRTLVASLPDRVEPGSARGEEPA